MPQQQQRTDANADVDPDRAAAIDERNESSGSIGSNGNDETNESDRGETTDETDEIDEPPALEKGEIFEVLRNQRRRYVLHFLKQDSRPVELGDLAQQIAAWEYETTLEDVTPAQRKRVYTTLQQTHLPKMDESGILTFDSDRGVIETTDRTRDISVYLEIVPGHEFAWRELYLSLGAVSSALVAALWLEIYPLTLLSNLTWAGIIALTLTVTAVAHIYYEKNMRLGAAEQPPELSYGADD